MDEPGFYLRVGYDRALEREAFQRLAERDLEACRRLLLRLGDRVGAGSDARESQRVCQLLLEVLQRVSYELHPPERAPEVYEAHRLMLIEQFAGCDLETARLRFRIALGQLLPAPAAAPTGNPLVERAKDDVRRHYRERLSLSRIAARLGVSPSYLSRAFRQETGMTLTEYIQRIRLAHARALLAEGARRISEIAYLVGYQNYRDFYRNFVKYERASPRSARQSLRERRPRRAAGPRG